MREELRAAERIVRIYTTRFYNAGADAGWHQPSVLQSLIEFKGDLPKGTGMDQSNMKMIYELKYVRNTHPELPLAEQLMSQVEVARQVVMIIHARCKGMVCPHTDSVYTERQMAAAIKMEFGQWQKLKKAGYEQLIFHMEQQKLIP